MVSGRRERFVKSRIIAVIDVFLTFLASNGLRAALATGGRDGTTA
jgi:hypothetical protein